MLTLDYSRAQTLTSKGNNDIDTSEGLSEPFVVVGVRIHYADIKTGGGGSTATADVTFNLVSDKDTDHNVDLLTIEDRGIGADVNLAIDPMIYEQWRCEGNDQVHVAWTNPDPLNVGYAVAIRVVPIMRISRGP